ncbi:MAG: hypothetical protein JKX68_12345 [Flavobacteriales bacterium]|nr:hypothetical protein [Flavobacteriales bacterium]
MKNIIVRGLISLIIGLVLSEIIYILSFATLKSWRLIGPLLISLVSFYLLTPKKK